MTARTDERQSGPASRSDAARGAVFLTGATGYVGGRLGPWLLDRGWELRCLARDEQKLKARPWASNPGVSIVEADIEDVHHVARAMSGCEVAYYLIHSMSTAGSAYAAQDYKLATLFAEAARFAGVKRIIYLGGLGETGADLSKHLQSRRDVEHALGSTGIPVTVLRAAMIIGSGSASFEILRYLVERLPIMITPRWVRTECQPIAIQNVLHYLAESIETPATTGETLDIGGPDVMNYDAIMQQCAEVLELPRRRIIPVPVLTPRLSSLWIHLVTPISSRIARPLAEGLRNRVVCRDNRAHELMPQRLLGVRESIEVAVQQAEHGNVSTRWSDAGIMPGDPDWAGGRTFVDERSIAIDATPESAFRAVCRVGGGHGWYAADWLWRLRGWMDRLAGGPGLRRGRRHPEHVDYGDALDFWRVTAIDRPRKLILRAEMKLPGIATLEFHIRPNPDHRAQSELTQVARFQPRGLFGLAYWYAVLPLHSVVFNGMMRGIQREAEQMTTENDLGSVAERTAPGSI